MLSMEDGGGGSMTRGYKGALDESRRLSALHWMDRYEDLEPGHPPAYTEFHRSSSSSPTLEREAVA